jgi:hypothetical protein
MEINKDLYDYQEGFHRQNFEDIYKTNGPDGRTRRDYGMIYKATSDIETFDAYRTYSTQ